jgi:AcrR family transcriptional regulator
MARTLKRPTGGRRDTGTDDPAADPPAGDAPAPPASRREEILAVAATTFARQGISNTTVRDIAEQAGILSGSLYHHFTSKDEILEEIVRAALDGDIALDARLAASDTPPEQAIRELFQRSLSFVHDHPEVAAIMDHSYHELNEMARFEFIRSRERGIRQAWTQVLRRGVESGVFRGDLDVELSFKAMIGSVSTASRWYDPQGRRSIDDIAEEFARIYLDGIRSAAGSDNAPGGGSAPAGA